MVKSVKVEDIRPNPMQPRKSFPEEGLRELADSIREHGILQPLIVREAGGGYEIVAGERRWRAAKLAGLKEVPVVVVEVADEDLLVKSLIENIHREDLTPVEREDAVYELWSSGRYRSYEELAKALGYADRSVVYHIIEAAGFRRRHPNVVPDNTPTRDIRLTAGLPDEERVELFKKRGEMGSRDFESFVSLYKACDESYRKKVVAEEGSLWKARERLELYQKGTPALKKALKEGRVSEGQAEKLINAMEELKERGVKVDAKRAAIVVRKMAKEKEHKEWEEEWEGREIKEELAPHERWEKPREEGGGPHGFLYDIMHTAATIRGWAIPTPVFMAREEWEKAVRYVEEMKKNLDYILRMSRFWSSDSYVEVYCDAGLRSQKPFWELIAYRIKGEEKALIHADAGLIEDESPVLGGNTPMEAYAAIQALKWIKKAVEEGTIKENEGVVLREDNDAIFYKLLRDLPWGGWEYLYREMIELAKPLKESGRLVIGRTSGWTNPAHGVAMILDSIGELEAREGVVDRRSDPKAKTSAYGT